MSEWKLVPMEPTDEMDEAAVEAIRARSGTYSYAALADGIYTAMLAAAPSPEWVKTSDRLPTLEDADERGRLWAVHTKKQSEYGPANTPFIAHWAHLEYLKKYTLATHWMPKSRVQPPEPPEVE